MARQTRLYQILMPIICNVYFSSKKPALLNSMKIKDHLPFVFPNNAGLNCTLHTLTQPIVRSLHTNVRECKHFLSPLSIQILMHVLSLPSR